MNTVRIFRGDVRNNVRIFRGDLLGLTIYR